MNIKSTMYRTWFAELFISLLVPNSSLIHLFTYFQLKHFHLDMLRSRPTSKHLTMRGQYIMTTANTMCKS